MKIICPKNNLLKSVNISLKAVPSKTTMPILECILMDATTNQIKFTTNDMELGIETIVVSGFVTSPLDHSLIFSGDASPILMASKVIG